jgi:hypothetical protein
VFHGRLANYEVNRRKAHLSDLTEVSLMGNGKSNEAERQELSGPGASFNGNTIIAANSCLKPVSVNTKQFALYFTDLLAQSRSLFQDLPCSFFYRGIEFP